MIGEQLVEATWREVGAFTGDSAKSYMLRLGRRQRELLAFVVTMTEDLSVAAQESAVYALVVIHRMFEHASGTPLPKASRKQISAAYERNRKELERLIGADDRFLERHAIQSAASEPFVMQYVCDVLFDPENPEAELSDDEVGEVFICLKTVIEVLHDLTARG